MKEKSLEMENVFHHTERNLLGSLKDKESNYQELRFQPKIKYNMEFYCLFAGLWCTSVKGCTGYGIQTLCRR